MKQRLAIFGLLLLGTGCLFYPEIEGKPEQLLFPPEIVLNTLEPPDSGRFDVDSDPECSPLVFKVGLIRDRNIDDILYLRWLLVDWDPNDEQTWDDSVITPTDAAERTGREYDVDLSEFSVDEVHTFKVVVADRPLLSQGNGVKFPDGSEGQLDTYQWTFRVASPGSGYCEVGGSE
ncbi:hypothetical protein ACFL2F_05330 [Myxococcota bacterium]